MHIKTDYWPKPIPVRRFDWSAFDDDTLDEGSIIGYGETEQEAIDDLLNQGFEKQITRFVNCLSCSKPMPYTVGTCPSCGYKEF